MDAIGKGLRKYYNAEKSSGNQNQTKEEEDLDADEKQEEKDKKLENIENNVTATIEQKN